jgi:hypothetical protein
LCPQPNTHALSLALRAPVELHHDSSSFCGCRRASVALPKTCRRRPRASLRPHRCSSAPEFPIEVSNSPMPLFSHVLPCCSRNRSPEWFAPPLSCSAADCHSRVPLRWCRVDNHVRRAISNLHVPFPTPRSPSALAPTSPANLHSGSERRHRWRSWNPGRACHWISGVHLRSGGLGLITLDLISTVHFGSGRSSARPRSRSVARSGLSV